MTKAQIAYIEKYLNSEAGEKGEVEDIKGCIYYFGSELATLRLLKHYRGNDNARQGWSENLDTFYFSIENIIS